MEMIGMKDSFKKIRQLLDELESSSAGEDPSRNRSSYSSCLNWLPASSIISNQPSSRTRPQYIGTFFVTASSLLAMFSRESAPEVFKSESLSHLERILLTRLFLMALFKVPLLAL
jgi:hypothetical protein